MLKHWEVYIVQTESGKLYTGITTDVKRRFDEHLTSKKGARFFRSDKPVTVVYREKCKDQSRALKREAMIKKLSRNEKLELVNRE
ncbi:MAG: GIY-YIG nuclease family protein [Bacteriovoracaceae bacterium]|nr:GIY-YIG nuclease family protein [Bacteriovoracaceae bacterium]